MVSPLWVRDIVLEHQIRHAVGASCRHVSRFYKRWSCQGLWFGDDHGPACGYRSSVRVKLTTLHPPPAPLKRSFEHSIRPVSFSAWILPHLAAFLPIHAVSHSASFISLLLIGPSECLIHQISISWHKTHIPLLLICRSQSRGITFRYHARPRRDSNIHPPLIKPG